MPKTQPTKIDELMRPINMNGLRGRMLRLPSPKKKNKEILYVNGLQTSLENIYFFAEKLTLYGNVTVPDLPGFGGMESFYKLKERPSLDNYADYLAAFIRLRYRGKKVAVVSTSFGFLLTTRMLQLYPSLAQKVSLLAGISGYMRHDDIKKPSLLTFRKFMAHVLCFRFPAWMARTFILRPNFIRLALYMSNKKDDSTDLQEFYASQVNLWRKNDLRTRAKIFLINSKVDLCRVNISINLMPYLVCGDQDPTINTRFIEQHAKIIFSSCELITYSNQSPIPSVYLSAEHGGQFIPIKLRRKLSSF